MITILQFSTFIHVFVQLSEVNMNEKAVVTQLQRSPKLRSLGRGKYLVGWPRLDMHPLAHRSLSGWQFIRVSDDARQLKFSEDIIIATSSVFDIFPCFSCKCDRECVGKERLCMGNDLEYRTPSHKFTENWKIFPKHYKLPRYGA